MTPVVYQNRNGTESLWADQTIILNYPNGPTAVRWYQFDVTGGNFPATAAQQQDWTNGTTVCGASCRRSLPTQTEMWP
jgi:hypothetical protein